MNRARWILLSLALLAAGAVAIVLRPRPPEPFPLAELVPDDVLCYAGFPDYRVLEGISTPWAQELKRRLEPARPHLAGPVAIYLDKQRQWVFLARLSRASALIAGAEVENGAAVTAQTPEALQRHKARGAALADRAEFKALGMRGWFNLEALRLDGRFRDFSAAGFEVSAGPPLSLRGRVLYRGGLFRTYLESYVQAPRHGAPQGDLAAGLALTEPPVRLWDEILHSIDMIDREKAEREAGVLSRDFLEGRPLRDFLARIGPGCGLALTALADGRPALTGWIELPDEGSRELAAKMTHRAIHDAIRVRRERGLPPAFDVAAEGAVWRLKYPWAAALRLGDAFTPAYTFEKQRFVISTSVAALAAPAVEAGDAHAAGGLRIDALLDLWRKHAPFLADDAFRGEARRRAASLMSRTFTAGTNEALRKQFPDPADFAKYQLQQQAQFEARALEEISKTSEGREELARVNASIEESAARLSWIERADVKGRFTGEGLEFELTLGLRSK